MPSAASWQALSLLEQLGNVGSEVGRALRAVGTPRGEAAAVRALELFDLTLQSGKGSRREVARSREVFCGLLQAGEAYGYDAAALEAYFMAFALAARSSR